jgi:hypothetical protein
MQSLRAWAASLQRDKRLLPVSLAFTALASQAAAAVSDPRWWVEPGQVDRYAWIGLVVFFLILFSIVHVYARFDRFTEHRAVKTPLRTTIPTMLTIALAYEMLPPLDHFSILLPSALLLTAVARDFKLWWRPASLEIEQ